jgi:hypothetical protein
LFPLQGNDIALCATPKSQGHLRCIANRRGFPSARSGDSTKCSASFALGRSLLSRTRDISWDPLPPVPPRSAVRTLHTSHSTLRTLRSSAMKR